MRIAYNDYKDQFTVVVFHVDFLLPAGREREKKERISEELKGVEKKREEGRMRAERESSENRVRAERGP